MTFEHALGVKLHENLAQVPCMTCEVSAAHKCFSKREVVMDFRETVAQAAPTERDNLVRHQIDRLDVGRARCQRGEIHGHDRAR